MTDILTTEIMTQAAAEIGIAVLLKATLIVTAAGMVTLLLRRSSAAARQLVWNAVFVILVVLPLASFMLPSWQFGSMEEIWLDAKDKTGAYHKTSMDSGTVGGGGSSISNINKTSEPTEIKPLGPSPIGMIALIFLVRYLKQTDAGRKFFDRMFLRMPLFGNLLGKVGLSRVTRTLSTLLSGGIPMLDCLKITSSTAGNVIVESHIMNARSMVAEGSSLTDAFRKTGHFPFMLNQMIGVGEATGNLDEMLNKLANFYDEEVETSVATLLSVLEPVLLLGVGGMVGIIVISMYLPIFSLMQQI